LSAAPAEANKRPERYNPAEIEPRWQAAWSEQPDLYAASAPDCGKPKYYVLEMLPYPSCRPSFQIPGKNGGLDYFCLEAGWLTTCSSPLAMAYC
jgi:hypothetical protein